MGVIIPKKINLNSINIIETYNTYKILYKLPYTCVSGIIIKLYNIYIKEYTGYYKIIINDENNIELFKSIEQHFQQTVKNYKNVLKNDGSHYYITIKKNDITTSIIKKYTNKINIHLLKIIKLAVNSNLIIYIL